MKKQRLTPILLSSLILLSACGTTKKQESHIEDAYEITGLEEKNWTPKPEIDEILACVDVVDLKEHKVIVCERSIAPSQAFVSHPIRVENTEEYSSFTENKFQLVTDQPLSTFAVDVDGASYSNVRRMINQGYLPNPDAVRVEEFVNYFSYNYSEPKGKDPVHISTEIGTCPWNNKHRLVKIGLKAKDLPVSELPNSNFVFLIDVSGSMSGPTRIDLVKSSMKLLLTQLRPADRVAIVTYASGVETRLESTPASEKDKIQKVLDGLIANGATSGGDGIIRAYKVAEDNLIKGGNNRVILCTDGDFNVGVSSDDELEKLIEKKRKSGVFLSVLGYGMGNYKDRKMQTLAQAGNGNHAYIDNIQEANKVLVKEFGATMYTVAKDVKMQVEFNPSKVQAYRLVGYETRHLNKEDFNDDTKDAGEMGVGHTVTALYEVIPVGIKSNAIGTVDPLKYQMESKPQANYNLSKDLLTIKVRYKQPDADISHKIETPVIDDGKNNVSGDYNFAASVAMFGQLLRDSQYKGDATYDGVVALAKLGLDNDDEGYRREFIRLAESTKGLAK